MKKINLTIGIPAYNESVSIKYLLLSLKKQVRKSYVLNRVVIISDGSSDNTVEVAKSIKWSKIQIISGKSRLGKPSRLNQLFRETNTQLLLTMDADSVIENPLFIEEIVKLYIKGSYSLIGGNAQPLPASTFVENCTNNYYESREELRNINDYSRTSLGFRGTALAFSKGFYKKINLPADILNDDAYIYFLAKSLKFKTIQSRESVVYFKSPDTISDFSKQMSRYIAGGRQLNQYFSDEISKDNKQQRAKLKTKLVLYQLRRSPLSYISLKILNLYSLMSTRNDKPVNSHWTIINSSKPSVML